MSISRRKRVVKMVGLVIGDMIDVIKTLRISYEVTIVGKPFLLFKLYKEEENKIIFFAKVAAYKNHCRLEGCSGRRIYCGKQYGILDFVDFYEKHGGTEDE